MERASILLQDTANTRWPLIELVTWLNDGMREIVLQNPTALSESLVLPLIAGTYQTVPGTYAQVLRVVRNLKTSADSPRIGGRVVRVIDRLTLDAVAPDWHDSDCTPQTSIVANVIFDEDDPFAFYVYPGNDGTGIVEVIASAIPTEVPYPTVNPTLLATYDVAIDIHDMYKNALVDYVMYRAYSKDASFAGSLARAAAHYQQFQGAIGVKIKDEMRNPNAKIPVNPGSAA
jgi:hypothetical protein